MEKKLILILVRVPKALQKALIIMFESYTNTVIMYMYVHVGLFSRWKEFCWLDGKAKKARSYVI